MGVVFFECYVLLEKKGQVHVVFKVFFLDSKSDPFLGPHFFSHFYFFSEIKYFWISFVMAVWPLLE